MDALLTVNEVADLLKVRPKCIHRYVREKRLGCVELTGARDRRFTPQQIEDFLRSRTITPPKKVDATAKRPLPFTQKSHEGGETESLSARARLREELRSWR